MTLMALSLSVGLVIDDAIVVLESIFRRVEARRGVRAARPSPARARSALAVISTTLAVCGVFVPIRFMQSTMGRYFLEFGVTVIVAVAISALVSLTLTPMLASRDAAPDAQGGRLLPHLRAWARAPWKRATRASCAGRSATSARRCGLAALTVASGCGVFATLPKSYFTQDDLNEISVSAKLPIGTPLRVTRRRAAQAGGRRATRAPK